MPTVLITTDFSAASNHALDYACLLLKDKNVTLDLLHVFELSLTYMAEGAALANMGSAIQDAEDQMQEEIRRVRETYPNIHIEGRIITGSLLKTLRQETHLIKPLFMILGTAGFTDFSFGDEDPLDALRNIKVPALFIPLGAALKPIRNIAFAFNYAHSGAATPTREIADFVRFADAELQVVHTDPYAQGVDEQQSAGESWLREKLTSLKPYFHWVQDPDVIHGLSGFLSDHPVDCVMVVPRKTGIWQNMFQKSRTKALARLNKIPVIAFHQKEL